MTYLQMRGLKRRAYILSVIFCLLTCFVTAQTQQWLWARSGNGSSAEYSTSEVTDTDGNIYLTGYFCSDSMTFGEQVIYSDGSDDIFFACYDNNGNLSWVKKFGSSGNDYAGGLATDHLGNICMLGYFGGDTIFFDSEMLVGKGYDDIFTVKFSSDGNVLWAKSFGGNDFDWGLNIACDANDNVFITGLYDSDTTLFGGHFLYNSGSDDAFIAKLDASGNVLWAKSLRGAQADAGTELSACADGNVILSGNFESDTLFYEANLLTNQGENDFFILKMNELGNLVWSHSFGGPGDDFIRGIDISTDGDIFLAGNFFSDTLIAGSDNLINQGGCDVFLIRCDSSGTAEWSFSTGGADWEIANEVTFNGVDHVYVCGQFRSTSIQFGPVGLDNDGTMNAFLVKFDLNGFVKWAKKIGGTYSDIATDVVTDTQGNVFLLGDYMSGTVEFGDSSVTNSGYSDVFLAKLASEFLDVTEKQNETVHLSVYPNPSSGLAFIEFSQSSERKVTIEIYNVLGEKVITVANHKTMPAGITKAEVQLPGGIYFIAVVTENTRSVLPLLIEK